MERVTDNKIKKRKKSKWRGGGGGTGTVDMKVLAARKAGVGVKVVWYM